MQIILNVPDSYGALSFVTLRERYHLGEKLQQLGELLAAALRYRLPEALDRAVDELTPTETIP
ncbi:hypothetical protein VB711_22290 [Cronbergia sp. UHCC 0137]|uniref:hypothetical protein n=1 Tax=Cronbergia sp. UHCC 0137 TaxID=3110239 RepID=UPI002B20A5C1|nr:hypothetical protein [Cronbergia sp. UHCC 0137]MEA5620546.1 hypothetical protein [Cronbergia sp. UHCC 0137]